MGSSQQAPQQPSYVTGEYQPIGQGEPGSFVAPPRTEYDYSPLDLAPSGQRRRRQFVAAAVGAFTVLLVGALIFLTYLLLRDEKPPSENDDLLASQTEIANKQATLAAEQTLVAQAAADQTEEAQNLNPNGTEPADATESTATEEGTTASQPNSEGTETSTNPTAPATTEGGPSVSGAGMTSEELVTLLPAADTMPNDLTATSDNTRTKEQVLEALGGSRAAETNLDTWGWSGNAERTYTPVDEAAADPATTGNIIVSVHGFGSSEGAAEALTYFSDFLVNGNGYTEVDAPQLGDSVRMLTSTGENGETYVALYIQKGSVMYRIGGYSAEGDPTQDVIDVATQMLGD